jgi:hypothetical protein
MKNPDRNSTGALLIRQLISGQFTLLTSDLFNQENQTQVQSDNLSARILLPRYNRLTNTWNVYPQVTIRTIQENPFDSLRLADSLQLNSPGRWTLQIADRVESSLSTPFPADSTDDTVTIVGLCVVPPKVIGYTASGYTMILYDTIANNTEWGAIFV